MPLKEAPLWGLCFASTTFRTLLTREKEKLRLPSGFHSVLTAVAVVITRRLLIHFTYWLTFVIPYDDSFLHLVSVLSLYSGSVMCWKMYKKERTSTVTLITFTPMAKKKKKKSRLSQSFVNSCQCMLVAYHALQVQFWYQTIPFCLFLCLHFSATAYAWTRSWQRRNLSFFWWPGWESLWVDLAVVGVYLDLVTILVFFKLNDSIVPWFSLACHTSAWALNALSSSLCPLSITRVWASKF